jgi:hypothetical protein
VVLAGDFNATREEVEAEWIQPPWHDVWLDLRGMDDGYTYDCSVNPNANQYQSRLDKVIAQGVGLKPETIVLVGRHTEEHDAPEQQVVEDPYGTPPPQQVLPPLHSSDHFGLLATFSPVIAPTNPT